jgi:DNA-binding NarL/FixJ family response regulator
MSTRILIVDDQALVRAGFRTILGAEPDLEVVGEAANGQQAVEEARRLRPDVTVMDIRMPVMDGLSATRALQELGDAVPRVLILTTFSEDQYVFDALRAGASGFLLKESSPDEIAEAVRVVARGESMLAPTVTSRLIEAFVDLAPQRSQAAVAEQQLAFLTPREHDVLRLVARGLSNAEIAARLYVGESTVKTHVSGVFTKLHLRDRVQAAIFAYESGLVVPGADPATG